MNTLPLRRMPLQSAVIVLHRPLWRRAWDGVIEAWRGSARRREERRAARLAAELDARTLADIGAPEWLHAEAAARHDRRAMELAELSRGIVSGAPW